MKAVSGAAVAEDPIAGATWDGHQTQIERQQQIDNVKEGAVVGWEAVDGEGGNGHEACAGELEVQVVHLHPEVALRVEESEAGRGAWPGLMGQWHAGGEVGVHRSSWEHLAKESPHVTRVDDLGALLHAALVDGDLPIRTRRVAPGDPRVPQDARPRDGGLAQPAPDAPGTLSNQEPEPGVDVPSVDPILVADLFHQRHGLTSSARAICPPVRMPCGSAWMGLPPSTALPDSRCSAVARVAAD